MPASISARAQLSWARFLRTLPHFDGTAALLIRLILAPVMIAAGCEKMHGENWFHSALDTFPFPFNVLPAELSWNLAMWTEFFGGIGLLLGLGTRMWAVALAVTMFVAAYSVHLPNGWAAIAPSQRPAAVYLTLANTPLPTPGSVMCIVTTSMSAPSMRPIVYGVPKRFSKRKPTSVT